MGEGINDYTKNIVDLRRHMWMAGIELELRRLIWQIAVVGKYISAKIHESNRKLAGFKNVYGEEQLALDRVSDDILKNKLAHSGFVSHYASEELEDIVAIGKGNEQYIVTADPLDGSSLVIPIWPSAPSSASTASRFSTRAGTRWWPRFTSPTGR
jgi:fructose-1,6-bisphosphatase I